MTGARLWMYEAVCPRCEEHYNPESLGKDYIQHWCQDGQFGGMPEQVWGLYLQNGGLFRKRLKKKTKLVNWKGNVIALAVIAAMMAGLVWIAVEADNRTEGLPACATEDSDNCYWDAEVQGNGEGQSFIVIDGEVTYK